MGSTERDRWALAGLDAFASLLRLLFDQEPASAREFAAWLWDVPAAALDGEWRLRIQESLGDGWGIPDVWLTTKNATLLIEVKIDGSADPKQLEVYEKYLASQGTPHRRLVSLTGREPRISAPEMTVMRLWDEVANRLRRHLEGNGCSELAVARCRFAVQQFDEFLQDRLLTFDAIRSPLSEGIRRHLDEFKSQPGRSPLLAGDQRSLDSLVGKPELKPLLDLMLMLRTILEGTPDRPKIAVGSGFDQWFGLNINQMEFFCYVELHAADELILERWGHGIDAASWDGERGETYEKHKAVRWYDTLDLADEKFFELDEGGQRALLTRFVTEGLAYGRKLRPAR